MNVSTIECIRHESICYDAQASISSGIKFLNSYLDRYSIVRWDDSTIQFQNDSPVCMTYVYVIDRLTQKVSGRRIKKSDADKALCAIPSDDLSLSFRDGRGVVELLRRENEPTATSLVIGTGFILIMIAWALSVIRRKSAP